MSRRFVGFTVQLAEDKWLCMDHNSCSAVVGPKEHRGYWPTRTDAEADILDAGESIEAARVSPVFAVPKGTFASFVAHCDRVGRIAEPKPAPVAPAHPYGCARCYGFGHVWDGAVQVPCLVCRDAKPAPVVAGEGRYGCLTTFPSGDSTFRALRGSEVGTREDASALLSNAHTLQGRTHEVVRILADGEHEAAVAAAVQAERTRLLAAIKGQRVEIMGAADGKNGIEAVRLYGQVDGLDFVRTLLGDKDVP